MFSNVLSYSISSLIVSRAEKKHFRELLLFIKINKWDENKSLIYVILFLLMQIIIAR